MGLYEDNEERFLNELRKDYSIHCDTCIALKQNYLSREDYGIDNHLKTLIWAYKRSLITKSEYNRRRNTIERFMFNK